MYVYTTPRTILELRRQLPKIAIIIIIIIIVNLTLHWDKMTNFIPYNQREEWKDVIPIPQTEMQDAPCKIAYTEEFTNVMDYFRAIVEKNEISERALELTADAIAQNPANYTAWYYRRVVLFGLGKDLSEEVKYMNEMTEENEKNYQVWYHRQAILEKYRKPEGELEMIAKMLEKDAKNYHAWAHRQWVLKEFNLWNGELEYVNKLLQEDLRNNSAWNHRFFVLQNTEDITSEQVRIREIDYAFQYIHKAPNNESPWNYAKGLANLKPELDSIYQLLEKRCKELLQRTSINAHAHYVLMDCYCRSNDPELISEAIVLCDSLIQYDAIRSKYWLYKKSKLEQKKRRLISQQK